MTGFIHNYRVGTRLGAAFGLLLVFLIALGAVALAKLAGMKADLDEISLDNNIKTSKIEIMFDRTAAVAVLVRDIALMDDATYARGRREILDSLRADYEAAWSELDAMPTDVQGRALRDRILEARNEAMPANDEVLRLAMQQLDDEAKAVLLDQAAPAIERWQQALRENLALQSVQNEEAYAHALESYQSARLQMLGIIAFALFASALLAWLITRSLTRPLGEATVVARDIAQGKLDGTILTQGRDEVATLLLSMRQMQAQLQSFADAQAEIAARHEAGEIDHRIPADRFPGAYGRMAEQVNELAGSHIAAVAAVSEFVAEYARGDLSRDFPELPGKKIATTRSVAAIKANMQAANDAIGELVTAATAGDFSRRGDASRFEFTYRDMVASLNELMASAHRGLDEVGSVMTAVAAGDLQQRADEALPGQFGRLAADANRTVDKLAQIVGQIRQGSDAINAAAGEIAAGNSDLSRRTEQQAASLEETASSMEELTSTVQHNADNARQANELARGAAEVAGQGGEVVGEVVRTMDGINEASRRIVDIIAVIDGIAFQTNILALNAAVEAARAGEQGRGFAVVASEVRSLAQRSAAAAKEIKGLIDDSVAKVEDGSALVNQAGTTMEEIVARVGKVSEIISEIAAASAEQSAGIEQVSQAVVHMDEGTQQNAALVEQASAAARALEQQAGTLVQTVAVFRADAANGDAVGFERHLRDAGALPATAAPAAVARAAPPRPPARPVLHRKAVGSDADWQEF
ncbi:methyl-accepting chemotaxis protein [Lysobacter sp. GX 14042]|uniref:methyl-accepting chemotaxis protein n=1 Tax=Lysobacter sp. GX 14042 TaxID=2907155 RepID=UPI0031BB8222